MAQIKGFLTAKCLQISAEKCIFWILYITILSSKTVVL